jgi:hypothetical protein
VSFGAFWIPAFAGMTREGAGMTTEGAGMTTEGAGDELPTYATPTSTSRAGGWPRKAVGLAVAP